MPNVIKYTTGSAPSNTLKKGNFYIGNGTADYGSTFWTGITPPAGGYSIYVNRVSGGPSIVCPPNDASLIYWTNGLSVSSNFLTNGNFSTGTTTPWSSYSDAGGVYQIVNISGDKPYTGSTSTYAVEYNYNAGMYRVTTGLLTVGVTYTFSFWGKVTSGTSMAINWNNQNGSGDANSWIGSATITTSWQRYTQTFTYSAAKDYFYFYTRNQTVGTLAIFTEFTVTEGGAAGGPGLTTAAESLKWFAAVPTDKMVFNRDYESIVTNGLILNLDAGFTPSYPTTGTTWYDVSTGGNNGTLTNGPTFSSSNGGSVVFDGVDDYVNVPNNTNLNSNIGTVSVWFNYTSAPGNGSVVLGKTDITSSFNGLNVFIYQGSVGAQIKSGDSITTILGPTVSTNTWYNYTLTYTSGASYSYYLNGTFIATNSLISFTFSTQPLRLARSVDTYWTNFGGQIPITQIYNRALTADEVFQNYNAQKSRFGL